MATMGDRVQGYFYGINHLIMSCKRAEIFGPNPKM